MRRSGVVSTMRATFVGPGVAQRAAYLASEQQADGVASRWCKPERAGRGDAHVDVMLNLEYHVEDVLVGMGLW